MPKCHRALAQWLREVGHDAQAVREIGLRKAADGAIWQHAVAHTLVIVTKDDDFVQRAQTSPAGPFIVWLRIGNTSNAARRAWFIPQLPKLVELIDRGFRVVEVR